MPYPILEEHRILPAPRRFFGGARRTLDELPVLPPGATYVFRCGGSFEQFGDAQSLDLAHPVVVSGGTVAVIDLRSRAITVELGIPSATPPEQFVLSAEFRCQVTDGLAVARDGTADIVDNLRRYLMQDRDLTDIGRQFNSDALGEALVLVQDQVYARADIVPPVVRGLSIAVISVSLRAPTDVETWQTRLLGIERGGELRRKSGGAELEEVERLVGLFERGPAAAEALGIVRGELPIAEVARQLRAGDDSQRIAAVGVLVELLKQGHGKGSDFDIQSSVQELLAAIGGSDRPSTGSSVNGQAKDPNPALDPGTPGDSTERPSYVPGAGDDD